MSAPSASPVSVVKRVTDKPFVSPHVGAADDLIIEDITVGAGEVASDGHTVLVHYVGVSASSGAQFDASWDRGEPFTFPLGGGFVLR